MFRLYEYPHKHCSKYVHCNYDVSIYVLCLCYCVYEVLAIKTLIWMLIE